MKIRFQFLVPTLCIIAAGPFAAQAVVTNTVSPAPAAAKAPAPTAKPAAPAALSRADLLKQLETRFQAIDTNKDGLVTREELDAADKTMVQRVQAGRAQKRTELFNRLDTNKDGQLSRAEFDAGDKMRVVAEDSAATIAKLDTNKDGKLSAAELQAPALADFNRLDTNKDGIISAGERPRRGARAR